MLASALDLSTKATIRRRRAQRSVLWLVLGMALFRDEPVAEVVRRLNICAQGLATYLPTHWEVREVTYAVNGREKRS